MPPFVSRKRHSPPPEAPTAKRQATTSKKATAKPRKPTLFDALDAPTSSKSTPADTKAFLASLDASDDSSLSDVSSGDFEDVPVSKKRKIEHAQEGRDEDDEEDDEMDWEDAIPAVDDAPAIGPADGEIEDLSISLHDDGGVAASKAIASSAAKKGPSKRQRQIRLRTHCVHVQALMWHNAVRNTWLNDKEVHQLLLAGLGEGAQREVDRWKDDMGIEREHKAASTSKIRGKGKKSKDKRKSNKRDGRDWGTDAGRQEKGTPNLSRGDPLLRLLKYLTGYWKKRFTVTAPGLRKLGYMPLKRLTDEVKSWNRDKQNVEDHGERVQTQQDFRRLAKTMEGSRDVGSQLFTALMRALGIEARMVANLQPAGIGWSKHEESRPKKAAKVEMQAVTGANEDSDVEEVTPAKSQKKAASSQGTTAPVKGSKSDKSSKNMERGTKIDAINLDDDESALSSPPSDLDDDDDASVVDVTTQTISKKRGKKYDRDLPFPVYWTEVLSPVSKTFIPVDPIILSTVASNQELLSSFEPRGKRADQAKQVMCYTIAHSQDGSAKDVTVRYLKRHQLPGRTKGFRMPAEKVPVYNKRGKVKKYEEYDWFKTVMSSYERPQRKRTEADGLEDSTDLKPYKPVADKPKVEAESLQWYKQSAEFVLERHLRREEALLPGSEPVKTFTTGKGDKAAEEPVYQRADVVATKTVESWHKEGREIKLGEQPLKMVPVRAVTLLRKREMEEVERETGEKLKQGLYAVAQTDWIIPPPIRNGVIPKNAFGNMDVYVPTMVPRGGVHIPLKGTAKICRKLDINYAEACTGFEFGKQRAVPVITGVVVAIEHEDAVVDAWEIEEVEKRRREDIKRQALTLGLWRKFLMGLRIVERMRSEYAGSAGKEEEINPFVKRAKKQQGHDTVMTDIKVEAVDRDHDHDDDGSVAAGGFFLPGQDEAASPAPESKHTEDMDLELGGGFMLDGAHDEPARPTAAKKLGDAPVTPMSLQSAHRKLQSDTDDVDADEQQDLEPKPSASRRKGPAKSTVKAKGKPAKQPARSKSTAAASATGKQRSARRAVKRVVHPQVESEDLASSLTSDDNDDEGGESVATKSDVGHVSPRVVVASKKSARGGEKKRTEVKSRYFESAAADDDDDGTEDDDDDDDEDGESEVEVVRPRKTTARTRMRT